MPCQAREGQRVCKAKHRAPSRPRGSAWPQHALGHHHLMRRYADVQPAAKAETGCRRSGRSVRPRREQGQPSSTPPSNNETTFPPHPPIPRAAERAFSSPRRLVHALIELKQNHKNKRQPRATPVLFQRPSPSCCSGPFASPAGPAPASPRGGEAIFSHRNATQLPA